ncbi:MAG: LPXTG cell wall anchor domain-containing protein, partial [Bifidobacteriaceae bacterium]|nr:LPXTG cell wall anchor domain-containing protein [Bifidobacteriaceae bacterium]
EFEFSLTGGDGSYRTVRNNAQGVANFAPIALTAPGRYSYLLEELPGADPNTFYDRHAQVVTLTATDDGAGHLVVTATPSEIVKFVNEGVTADDTPPDENSLASTGATANTLAVVAMLLIATGTWLIRRRRSPFSSIVRTFGGPGSKV